MAKNIEKILILALFFLGVNFCNVAWAAADTDECAGLSGSAKNMCEGFASDLAKSKAESRAEAESAAKEAEASISTVKVVPPPAQNGSSGGLTTRPFLPSPKLPTLPGEQTPSDTGRASFPALPTVTIQKTPAPSSGKMMQTESQKPAFTAPKTILVPKVPTVKTETNDIDATEAKESKQAPGKAPNNYNIY